MMNRTAFFSQNPNANTISTRCFQTLLSAAPMWLLWLVTICLWLCYGDQEAALFMVAGLPRDLGALIFRQASGGMVAAISDTSGSPTDPIPDDPPPSN